MKLLDLEHIFEIPSSYSTISLIVLEKTSKDLRAIELKYLYLFIFIFIFIFTSRPCRGDVGLLATAT